jgi:hypothetical protein
MQNLALKKMIIKQRTRVEKMANRMKRQPKKLPLKIKKIKETKRKKKRKSGKMNANLKYFSKMISTDFTQANLYSLGIYTHGSSLICLFTSYTAGVCH